MPTQRKKIIIGGEYRESYFNLVKILRSGMLKNAGARLEEDGEGNAVIVTDAEEYVYGGGENSAAAERDISIGKEGASWFAPLRKGEAFDDGMSGWKQLAYRVAGAFHDEFSIIEYKRCDGSGNTDARQVEANVNAIVKRFFGNRNVAVIKGNDREKGSEDIYGASVKLELAGTGQSHFTVMCKIFFRRTDRGVTPLTAAEARQINARLEQAEDNDEPIKLTAEESANINNVTVNAVRDLVAGAYPISFKDSLCFSAARVTNPDTGRTEDNYDLKTYKALAARAHANNAPVTCESVRVLGISHVEWINDYYEIAFGGKVVMQAVVGFGGSITLRCLNCNGANLITSNVISYNIENEDGVKRRINITLDYSQENLGIGEDTLKEIMEKSELANHLFEVRCENNPRIGKACLSCVCQSQTVSVGGKTKCADCPYPEVVYTDYSGDRPVRYLTDGMVFVNDKLTMTLKENAAECSRCGRSFMKETLTDGLCGLCAEAGKLEGEALIRAKKRYAKYRNVFPYDVRLKHARHKKFCVEDDTSLVFALGDDVYVLDKLELKKDGFISRPNRITK